VEEDNVKEEAAKDALEGTVESQPGSKHVVYANINSQIEDFTFLITALYHWEKQRPAIAPTQITDPKLLMQKSNKPPPKEEKSKGDKEKEKNKDQPVEEKAKPDGPPAASDAADS